MLSVGRSILLTYIGRERGRECVAGGKIYSDCNGHSGPLTNIMLNYGPLHGLNVMLSCMMDFILHKPLRSMKWDKKPLQLEFTEGWAQTEIPELTKLDEPAVRLHACVLSLCFEIFEERHLCGVPHGRSQGLLTPLVKVWGWRGQVCTGKRLWSPISNCPCRSGGGPGWVLISSVHLIDASTLEKAEHTPLWVRLILPSFSAHTSGQATATAKKLCPVWEGASGRKSTIDISILRYEVHKEPQEWRFCMMCNIPTTAVN